MAADLTMEPTLAPVRPARRLHYRGLEVTLAMLAGTEAPRAGRRMLWRGVAFDGARLDARTPAPRLGAQFYRGVFF